MLRLCSLKELNSVSEPVAWKLVDTLFQQTRSLIIGAACFIFVGLVGFIGTASFWYLAGSVTIAVTCAMRLWLSHIYTFSRDRVSAITWVRRNLWLAWTMAACWGICGGAAILFEANPILLVMVVGTLSALLIGAAVRACAVPAIAHGQVCLAVAPMCIACLASGHPYFVAFSIPVALQAVAAVSLTKFLHGLTLELLLRDEEKTELVATLEAARQELEATNAHLEGLALTDALTGIANRRAFDLAATREWRRSIRDSTMVGMLLLDIDHFKSFNDVYGHQAGDLCLKEVAATIALALRRPGDFVARYGGEEFAVILPRTDLQGALNIGEAIVQAFATLAIQRNDTDAHDHITVSIGAAALPANPKMTVDQLTALADSALYAAKRGGRNRVYAAESAEAVPATVH